MTFLMSSFAGGVRDSFTSLGASVVVAPPQVTLTS